MKKNSNSSDKKYKVLIANRGNPDYREDPEHPLFETPTDYWAEAIDIPGCSALCREYISQWYLGRGNWYGGDVVISATGKRIGVISYDGKYWSDSLPNSPYAGRAPRGVAKKTQSRWGNTDRVTRASKALGAYLKEDPGDIRACIVDLLTDLQHLCRAEHIDWDAANVTAIGHLEEENKCCRKQ